jgi:D-3-phosphoglycerate dehydrogenase
MSTFRVAITDDLLGHDGVPAWPEIDFAPFESDPRIDYIRLPFTPERAIPSQDLKEFDGLVMANARLDQESFAADGRLALVAFFGVGYDQVDLAACTRNGVALAIAPDAVRRPVAVGIVSLMLAVTGNLLAKDRIARQGPQGWAKAPGTKGVGLVGKTLGVLGLGNIGRELVRLVTPFGMNVIVYDPYVRADVADGLGATLVELDELVSESDILAICCPLNEDTRELIDAARIARMKPTAYLINAARGAIVDQDALAEALSCGQLAGAGLDVFVREPEAADHAIMRLENVVLAPHSVALTDQCIHDIWVACVEATLDVMHGREPCNVVNRADLGSTSWPAKLARFRAAFGES